MNVFYAKTPRRQDAKEGTPTPIPRFVVASSSGSRSATRTFAFFLASWRLGVLACCLYAIMFSGAGGCGYTTAELFPDEYRSVAVPTFANRTFFRGVEFDLTEAVVKEVEQRTPYKVIDTNIADTLLNATITGVSTRQLSRTREAGLPQEVQVTVTVDFEWIDQRSGAKLATRRGFSSVGRYVPTQPVGESFEVGQHAAVERLARDMVSALRGGW
ncbi:MAG: LptE family protein [Planctomycetota bacterium]